MATLDISRTEFLVAEDVRFTRVTIAKMLTSLGALVIHEVEDGRSALHRLEELGPRNYCVISDLEMPNLDGLGLLRAIRTGTGAIPHDLPFVMLTGHSGYERLGPALLLDLDAFLTKPVSRATIEKCLARVLGAAPRRIGAPDSYRSAEASGGPIVDGAQADSASQTERQVALAELPDGAVLARDLLFSNGRLLLPARTRVSKRVVQRLNEIAQVSGLASEVWILG